MDPIDQEANRMMNRYRWHMTNRVRGETEEMQRTLCAFLHLELSLFMRIKYFVSVTIKGLNNSECNARAAIIRGEFPMETFNELLLEYFDAIMAASEGHVMRATELTRGMFQQVQIWLRMLQDHN
jgi:hypothetical protein